MTVRNKRSDSTHREQAKKRKLKIIDETDGDFYEAFIEFPSYQTWKLFNQSGEILRGVYYGETKRSYVFLHRHECPEDEIQTSIHESLHAAIDQCREWEYDDLNLGKILDKDLIRMDDTEEHNMIRIALQAERYFGE